MPAHRFAIRDAAANLQSPSSPPWLASTAARLLSGRRPLRRRRNVLVQPEQVARIIFGFQCSEPRVVRAISAGYAIDLVLRHEIDVDATGCERRGVSEQLPRPFDRAPLISLVAPSR